MLRTEEWRGCQNYNVNSRINYLLISIESDKAVLGRNFLILLLEDSCLAVVNTVLECVAKGSDLKVGTSTEEVDGCSGSAAATTDNTRLENGSVGSLEKAMGIPFKGEGVLVAYAGLEELSPDGVMTARGI